jgi:hypothetical protein
VAFLEGANFVFDHSSVLGPSAQRLDEAVGNHELGLGSWGVDPIVDQAARI